MDIGQKMIMEAYSGALCSDPWKGFVTCLQESISADYAALYFHTRGVDVTGARSVHSENCEKADPDFALIEQIYQRRASPYYRMKAELAYSQSDLLDTETWSDKAYLNEYLHPRKHHQMLSVRIPEYIGSNAWIVVSRRSGHFREDAGRFLEMLSPHVGTAIQYRAELERERLRTKLSSAVAHRLNFHWLTFARSGEVIEADEQARCLLSRAGVLGFDAHGTLRLSSQRRTSELQTALTAAADDMSAEPKVVLLSEVPDLRILILPIGGRSIQGGADAVAVGYIPGEGGRSPSSAQRIQSVFNVTRREAELTLDLCRGLSIAESARNLGLTENSARVYTKRIYAKTGAKGLSDLILTVMGSVAVLA